MSAEALALPATEAPPAPGAPQGPGRVWATKGIAFWAVLSAILVKARPESLLELGSGRSTTFLADYAFRFRKRFVSIEQDAAWHAKVAEDLRCMNVKGSYVHHVPLDTRETPPWYDREKLAAATGDKAFDLVFVDGPQGAGRRNPEGRKAVRRACRAARLIIVDDVHRPYNLTMFRELAQKRFPTGGVAYHRYANNVIGLAAAEEWKGLLTGCFDFLDQPWTPEMPDLPKPVGKQEARDDDA